MKHVPPVEILLTVSPAPSGLFHVITVERIRDGRKVRTTIKDAPDIDHPTIQRIIRSLNHD